MLARNNGPLARFHWSEPLERKIAVASETLCTLTLDVAPGRAGDLIRTDTYYPGWQVSPVAEEVKMQFEPPCFTRIHVPGDVTRLRFQYEPRFWRLGLCIAAGSAALIAVLLAVIVKRKKVSASSLVPI